MKKLSKLLLYLLSFILSAELYAQITPTPVTVSNGVVTLKGKGKLGGTKDGAQLRRYKKSYMTGDFSLQAYFRSLTNSDRSFTGIAFRNEGTTAKTDGGIPMALIIYDNNQLKCFTKLTANSPIQLVVTIPNVKVPGYLKLERAANDLKYYYATDSETATTINWQLVSTVPNLFTNWTNITQNFITGSATGVVQTAVISKVILGSGSGTTTTVNPPVIASSPVSVVEGTSVTFTATGCSGDVIWHRVSGTTNYSSFPISSTLTVSSPTATHSYYAICQKGGVSSAASNTIEVMALSGNNTGIAGRLIAPTIPVMPNVTEWNRFYTTTLPTITIPQKFSPIFGENRDVVSMIWHYPYRNLFAYDSNVGETNPATKAARELAEMRRVGIKVINANYLVPCVEMDNDSRNCLANPPINPFTDVVIGKGITDDSGIQGWNDWINYWRDPIWAEQRFHAPIANGKYNLFMMCTDYEASHTRSDRQIDVNYQVVAHYAQDEVINGWVGQMYLSPKNSLAYVNSALFTTASNTPAWFNAADNTVPERFRGKKISGNPKFYGMTEQAHYQESMKPEGYVMKDQNGNNWLTLTHFGNAEGTGINKNSTPNIEHWQTQIIGLGQANAIECNKTGQPFFYQLKLDNQRGDGYFYSPENKTYNDNKYNGEHNRYGILNCDFPDGAAGNGLDGQNDCILTSPGSERAPAYIQEGQTIFSMFVGSKGIQIWGSSYDSEALPRTKTGNPQRGDRQLERNYGNNDLEGVGYTVRGWNRLGQKHLIQNSSIGYSVFDLMAETDTKYLNDETEYSVNNGVTWYKGNALIYQKNRIPATLAMVNDRLGIIALATQEAYNECSTQGITLIKVKYNNNVYDIEILPNHVPNIVLYKMGSSSGTSQNTTVNPPTITANPTNPTAGTNVVLTATGCAGTVKWWLTDAQIATGATYSITNASANTSYTATCTVDSRSSIMSNSITIAAAPVTTGGVTITEPNKPAYYFSNGHITSYYDNNINYPAIHKSGTRSGTNYAGKILSGIEMQSNYSITEDLAWLKNDKIKVGINLLRGGQIAWLSLLNSSTNLVYNGYDGGLQVGIDAYQKKDGYTQNGKVSNSAPNNSGAVTSYNNAMGGDFNNNSQSLIDYHAITNGYVVKYRPIFYTLDCEWTQVTIEVKYTLEPGAYAVRAEYTYHSFRTDGQWDGGGFDGAVIPACFLVNSLSKYQTYTGNRPFTNDAIEEGVLPIQNSGGRYVDSPAEPILGVHATERFSCVFNPSTLTTFGLYIPTSANSEYGHLKQLEVYAGNGAGTEFTGGFTYIDFNQDFNIVNRGDFTKTMTAYIMATPSPTQARAEAYRLKTLLGN